MYSSTGVRRLPRDTVTRLCYTMTELPQYETLVGDLEDARLISDLTDIDCLAMALNV